ncbi:MAG: hypothetical protein IJP79_07420 [Paludibacteraceae bacterium]|nr:hypothetical protein [Paludibacteraceae bacterium]MBQ6963514.1 hypothetical protein [Paludibacteraceae bacterium]MBQ7662473.1 hypothetical protein [Prevotella sp.]MBQ7748304.1 hypothetical protein [Paludibacteraceae bacterium]
MNNEVHRFRRGNNLYLVKIANTQPQNHSSVVYIVFRINQHGVFCAADISYRVTTDSSIYDFCDEEEAKTLKRSDTFYKKHIEAKRKAVALFREK